MNNEEQLNQLFKDLLGQRSSIDLLKAILKTRRISNSYIFAGPGGVGKKLAVLRFLEGFLSKDFLSFKERKRLELKNHPDLLWIEPTVLNKGKLVPQSKLDLESVPKKNKPIIRLGQIREIIRFLAKQPIEATRGMVVIENIEMIQESASNALLKTLEEPGHGLILLISEKPENLLTTIKSRCQTIKFSHLDLQEVKEIIEKSNELVEEEVALIYSQEGLIQLSNGSPGQTIKNLKIFSQIPKSILTRLENMPEKNIEALDIAKDICEELNEQQQIWLIGWLQYNFWNKGLGIFPLERLEHLKRNIVSFVQPRLAWEVTLLELIKND